LPNIGQLSEKAATRNALVFATGVFLFWTSVQARRSDLRSNVTAAPNLPPAIDFTNPDIYAQRLPVQELAELRRTAPIWWNEQPPDVGGFGDGGYWVVSKHRDVREVSLRSDVFSSAKKSIVPRYKVTGGGGQIEAGAASMIMMDDPEHTRLRKIISRGSRRAPSSGCAPNSVNARSGSPRRPPNRARATSSSRSRVNCLCRT
jgi:hypothetical protein